MKRVLLCAALIAWSGMASAVVYKWVDAQGKVQYGDRPPDGVHAEVVEGLGTHLSRPPAHRRLRPSKPAKSRLCRTTWRKPERSNARTLRIGTSISSKAASCTRPVPTANDSI
jgi:hypothetical protein